LGCNWQFAPWSTASFHWATQREVTPTLSSTAALIVVSIAR